MYLYITKNDSIFSVIVENCRQENQFVSYIVFIGVCFMAVETKVEIFMKFRTKDI